MIETISASLLHVGRRLTHERVRLNLPDTEDRGVLAFWDGALTAVLSRCHGQPGSAGADCWVVELGFGDCAPPPAGRSFHSLGEALLWLEATCEAEADARI